MLAQEIVIWAIVGMALLLVAAMIWRGEPICWRSNWVARMSRIAAPLKDWAQIVKRDVHAIYVANREAHAKLANRDVPANLARHHVLWYANVLAIAGVWIAAFAIGAASIALAYQYFVARISN